MTHPDLLLCNLIKRDWNFCYSLKEYLGFLFPAAPESNIGDYRVTFIAIMHVLNSVFI
jgi:hypothetical protein